MRKLFANFNRFHFANQNLRTLGRRETRKFRDCAGALPYNFGVKRAIDDDRLSDFIRFLRRKDIRAAKLQFLFIIVINIFYNDDRLLRGADHAVIESFGMQDRRSRKLNIRRRIDNGRRITRPYAERGFSRRIRRFHHAGTARCKNQVRLAHDHTGKRNCGHIDPPDDVLGSTCRNSGFQNDFENRS